MLVEGGPILALAGPTACGKTDAGVELAQILGTEIISADSVQVYRGFDIGAAKPNEALRARVRHHLLDVADPAEEYNAARFRDDASAIAASLWADGKIPLVVGGTGLYIKALSEGMSLSIPVSPQAESKMEEMMRQGGQKLMYQTLMETDPAWAARVHPNDTFRTYRGLGVFLSSGHTMSEINRKAPSRSVWDTLILVLNPPREVLYQRIIQRTDNMLKNGWLEEVNRLKKMGYNITIKAMRSIGYKEVFALSEGLMEPEQARNAIIKGTKALARRQLTWFRKVEGAVFIPLEENETARQIAEKIMRLDDVRKFFTLHGLKAR